MVFRDAHLKVDRANKHIADAKAMIFCFHSTEYNFVREEINVNTGDKLIHYGFAKPFPLPDLALIIGDAIHNLKTALDYAWLATITTFAPEAVSKFSKFPVYESSVRLEEALKSRNIHTACPALYKFILGIKPYRDAGNYSLWAIHKLDIRDKHRLLLPLAPVSAVVDLTLEHEDGTVTGGITWSTIAEGTSYTVPIPASQHVKVKDYGCLAFAIVFNKGLPTENLEIVPTLNSLCEVTMSTIETIEAFFETRG